MESLTPRPPTGVDELDPDAHARRDDPWTSHAAAVTVNLTRRQVQVLEAFQWKDRTVSAVVSLGLTDEEMVTWVHDHPPRVGPPSQAMQKKPSPSGLRTARKALLDAGLVARAEGYLRRTTMGNWAFVWVLTEAGRAFQVPQ